MNRGAALLAVYILLRGSDGTLLKALQKAGAATQAAGGPEVISFCNVFFFSSLVCGLVMLTLHRKSVIAGLPMLSAADRGLLALQSFSGFFLGPVAFFLALNRLTVTQQTLLFSLGIPFSALAAHLLLRERLPRAFLPSCALLIAGLLLASQPQMVQSTMVRLDPIGAVWALIGVVAFGFSGLLNRRVSQRGLGAGFSVGLSSLAAAVVFGMIALVVYGPGHFFYLRDWWVLGVIGGYAMVITLGSQWSLMQAYARFEVSRISFWAPLTIVVAIGEAWLLLGEELQARGVLGAALILLAVAIVQIEAAASTPADRPASNF